MTSEERIRNSALRLFVERGFSCPTAAITKDAGVSNGLLFTYFETKNDLIIDLYVRIRQDYFEDAMKTFGALEMSSQSFVPELRKAWFHQIDWCLTHWVEFCYMRTFEDSELYESLLEMGGNTVSKTDEFILAQVAKGVEMGVIRKMNAHLMVDIGNAITFAVVRFLHEHPEKRNSRAFMDQAWNVYLSAVGT